MAKRTRKSKAQATVASEDLHVSVPRNTASPICPDASKPAKAAYFNRELSWLAFNRRVLEQAQNEKVPLLERVKFLAIVSSNLDEFFEIRVAGIIQQVDSDITEPSIASTPWSPPWSRTNTAAGTSSSCPRWPDKTS